MKNSEMVAVAVIAVALLAADNPASAGPSLYDWNAEKSPVMVETDSGLIFLGTDKEVWRAYSWSMADDENEEPLFLVDFDKDNTYDVIGAGEPTFALHHSSNPAWVMENGCNQASLADFAVDDKLDVMCQSGDDITVYTYDYQKIWSASLGRNIDWCRAGDINGDLKADLECKFRGGNNYTRIDVNAGKFIAQQSSETKLDSGTVELDEAQPTNVLDGDQEFDFNGDGTAEESVVADGNAVVLQSRSKKEAIARVDLGGEPVAALVSNLDSKEQPEIVAVTDDEIVIIDGSGEKLGSYSTNAKSYTRYPVADLQSVYANNFDDNAKAQKTVQDLKEDLAQCYSRRVERNQFTGIGQLILKVYVDGSANVSKVEQVHSEVNDDRIERCAKNALKGGDYPAADGDQATINTVMTFTFADK